MEGPEFCMLRFWFCLLRRARIFCLRFGEVVRERRDDRLLTYMDVMAMSVASPVLAFVTPNRKPSQLLVSCELVGLPACML